MPGEMLHKTLEETLFFSTTETGCERLSRLAALPQVRAAALLEIQRLAAVLNDNPLDRRYDEAVRSLYERTAGHVVGEYEGFLRRYLTYLVTAVQPTAAELCRQQLPGDASPQAYEQ